MSSDTGAFSLEQKKYIIQPRWSLFDLFATGLVAPIAGGGVPTVFYNSFQLTKAGITCIGFRYWGQGTTTSAVAVYFNLWRDDGVAGFTNVATHTQSMIWGVQEYKINWDVPYTWQPSDVYKRFAISFWRTPSGAHDISIATLVSALGHGTGANEYQLMWAGPYYIIGYSGANPGPHTTPPATYNVNTFLYAIEPVFTL